MMAMSSEWPTIYQSKLCSGYLKIDGNKADKSVVVKKWKEPYLKEFIT